MVPDFLDCPEARRGVEWLPAFRTIRVVFESLIWPFCLEFGRTPPVGRSCTHDHRQAHAGAGGGRSPGISKIFRNICRGDGDLVA